MDKDESSARRLDQEAPPPYHQTIPTYEQQTHQPRVHQIIVNPPKAPWLKKCMCFSLKTGCLIFGWMNIIFQVFTAIVLAHLSKKILEQEIMKVSDDLDDDHDDDNDGDLELRLSYALSLFLIAGLGVISILILSNVFLLIGVYKKKLMLLKTFIIINSIMLLLGTFGIMKNMAMGLYDLKNIFERIGMCGWIIYTIIVVLSYYRELQIELLSKQQSATRRYSPPPVYEP